ncbi:MAG TPA: hypothetical protein VIU82_14860 [Bosea sp. (in: a-proteobacteria)]
MKNGIAIMPNSTAVAPSCARRKRNNSRNRAVRAGDAPAAVPGFAFIAGEVMPSDVRLSLSPIDAAGVEPARARPVLGRGKGPMTA